MFLISIITNAMGNLVEEFASKTNIRVSADSSRTEPLTTLPLVLNYELEGITPTNQKIGETRCDSANFTCVFRLSKVRETKEDLNIYGEYLLSIFRNDWLVTLEDFANADTLTKFNLQEFLEDKYIIKFQRVTPKIDREGRVESLLLICDFIIKKQ